MVSIDDMDKFEQKEMKKIRSLFKTNTSKQTVYGRGKKLNKPKHKT